MTSLKTKIVLGGAAGAAVCVACIAFMRTDESPARKEMAQRNDLAMRLVEQGQKEYKTIAMRPFADLQSPNAVRELMNSLEFVPGNDPRPGRKILLLDQVAAFVHMRFVDPSVSSYKKWRRSSGKEIIPIEELRRMWLVAQNYQNEFGSPLPEDAAEEWLFDQFWNASLHKKNRPIAVAIASEAKGLLAACAPFDAMNKSARPALSGGLPHELWVGAIGGTCQPWWRTVGATNGAVAPHLDKTECAEVGLIFEFNDGSRRPMVLTFLWDPRAKTWELEWVNVYNFPLEKNCCVEY